MIDCAIVIEPDTDLLNIIRANLAASPQFESINHTEHPSLLERPISVNIEVKRTGVDFVKAQIQCGVWVTAQFSRLDRLVACVREAQNLERQEEQQEEQQDEQQQQQQQQQQAQRQMPPQWPQLPQRIGHMSLGATTTSASSSTTLAGEATASTPTSTAGAGASFTTAAVEAPSSATGSSIHNADAGHADAPTMIPFLPLVIVQGHDWHFLAATQNEMGGTVRGHFFSF
jgi:TolA-binding protein